ncbi:MAG: hypothetical protein GPW19_00510, partial [Euryarchaeota archaeon]|nr:hypothetical protein [Euryarchaeota archaeon]
MGWEKEEIDEIINDLKSGDVSSLISKNVPIIYDALDLDFIVPSETVKNSLRSLPPDQQILFQQIFSDQSLREVYDSYVLKVKVSNLKNTLLTPKFSYMFLGGFMGEIGRSMLLLNFSGNLVIVDAGTKVSDNPWNKYPSLDILKELSDRIVAVFITHVHQDHYALLPILLKILRPDVNVYMTPQSLLILPVLLNDIFNITTRDFREQFLYQDPARPDLNRDRFKNEVIIRITPVSYGQELSFPTFSVKVLDAKHIYGSASFLFTSSEGLKVLYSGDIGSTAVPEKTDILFLESTYGNKDHAPFEEERSRFINDVKETLLSGNPVFLPTFALGRAQDILKMLYDSMLSGELPKAEIYVGGLAFPITKAIPEYKDIPFKSIDEIPDARGPKIVIVSSNTMLSGVSSEYATDFISIPSLIAITGYQDAESPARFLYSQRDLPKVDIFGHKYDRRARIESYDFSAHADQSDLVSYVAMAGPKTVVLMHGELDSSNVLYRLLTSKYKGMSVIASKYLTVYSQKHLLADFSNYWGIYDISSGFYCFTCNSFLPGYRTALIHSFSNPHHEISSIPGESYLKLSILATPYYSSVPSNIQYDLVKNGVKVWSVNSETLKTPQGKYYLSVFKFIPSPSGSPSLSTVRDHIQTLLNSYLPVSAGSIASTGTDPTVYQKGNEFRAELQGPTSFRSKVLIEYSATNGTRSSPTVSWVLNRLKSVLAPYNVVSDSFPVYYKVFLNPLYNDLTPFPSKTWYRVVKEGDKDVLYVSSNIYYDPSLLKYLLVSLNARRFLLDRIPSGLTQSAVDGFQYWFYKRFIGDDLPYLKSTLSVLTDDVLKYYAIFEYLLGSAFPPDPNSFNSKNI